MSVYLISYFIFQRIRTNALKDAHDRNILPQNFDQKLFKYGGDKKDEAHFVRILRQLLKVRVPGTDGSRQVRQVSSIYY